MLITGPGTAADRRALVDRLLHRKAIRRAEAARIPARGRYSPCELSYAQEQLWLAVQLDDHSAAYNIPRRLWVEGPLDLDAVAFSLNAVVARHEALRTSFVAADGRPMQVVHPVAHLRVGVVDASHVDRVHRECVALAIARAEARHTFDLRRAPLLRAAVVRFAGDRHLLLLTIHHIVADGWSMGVLVSEFSAFYRERTTATPADLPPPPVQYPDFAVWQREQLRGDALDRMVAHWKDRLADLPPTELPTVRPAPARRSGRGGSEPLPVMPDVAAGVQEIARQTGTTTFVTWVAATAVWLHRYSGRRDIVIGAPIANRLQAEVDAVIGCFVNPVVLRIHVRPAMTFHDLALGVRDVATDAFAHQDAPFGRVVDAVRTRQDAMTPLFRVACVFHNTPPGKVDVTSLRGTPFATGGGSARFDVELNVWQSPDRAGGTFVYDADLFDGAAAARMASHLTTLLADACRHPRRPISALSMLTDAERVQIASWNATSRAWPFQSVFDIIAAQATRTPDAPAVIGDDLVWDSATLLDRAERIARALRRRGVKRGDRVALYAPRSHATIAAVLGVLEIGAAYVPLDVAAPAARLADQVTHAHAAVVLAADDAGDVAGEAPVLRLGEALAMGDGAPAIEPVRVEATDLAYIIYTSGSTGSPKGVMITHGGLSNYLRWAHEAYGLEPRSRGAAPFHTPLAYDLTVTSVLVPLAAGHAVRVIAEADDLDGLVRACRAGEPFGCVKATPPHLRALLDLVDPSLLSRRDDTFVVGGEALDAALLERWLAAAPATRVMNEYGPTETVVGCCVAELRAGMAVADPVPIGTPIANTQLYVVTPHWQLAPVDVAGDLWIGGAGVARGYLDRPDLTAERFVPDAFGDAAGGRLYRSGDRVRRRGDGVLEYLGRQDDQIKIRGHRVELGEVEAALRQQTGVRDAVAIFDARDAGQISAYVVADADAGVTGETLQRALGARLPDYMVPSAIALCEALPMTRHGKVDRRQLPSLAPAARDGASAGPRTPIEELLAGIWSDVLGVERIGPADNFFELGGHSLRGAQVLARVRQTFGVELPLRVVFEAPTIAALADRVLAGTVSPAATAVPPLVRGRPSDVAPLSLIQQGLWLLQQLDPDSGFLNVPIVLRLRGPLSIAALRRSVAVLLERHEVLRATFAVERGELLQRVHADAGAVLPIVALETLPEATQSVVARRLAGREMNRAFDLATAPPFRRAILRFTADDHILCFTLHHVATDGWSNGIVIRELNVLYRAFTTGGPVPLAPPTLQYADFARWQRDWLAGEVLDRQLDYWRRTLGDLVGADPLFPRRFTRTRASRTRATESDASDVELLHALKRLGRRSGVTLHMTLVAAFGVVVHAVTSRPVFAIGTDVANRRDAQLESVVGCFVNQLVLRADVTGDPTFDDLLRRTRTTMFEAYDHQDVPFDRVMQALRVTPQDPLVQVSLVLQNTPGAAPDLHGLAVERFDVELRDTKVDVMLMLAEGPDGVLARLEYDTDLLDAHAATSLLGGLMAVLHDVVDDPAVRVSTLVQRLAERERLSSRARQDAYAAARAHSLLRRAVSTVGN
jgi:amino acid adenylation domain-containing protein